jgi:hypothetical protein
MSEPKGKYIIEIFKSTKFNIDKSWIVVELPLFSSLIYFIDAEQVNSDYFMDIECVCGSIFHLPFDLIELCNQKWNECVTMNLNYIKFTYNNYDS